MSETLSAEELENTVWIDDDGYPTEAALEAVATLPSPQVFEVMRRAWWMPTHGVRNDLSAAEAEMVGELEGTPWRLATGGWSGNEELIDAFQESWSWRWTWRLTAAGGLYIFDAPAKELPGGRVVPPEKDGTYRLRCDVTEAADALAAAVEAQRAGHLYVLSQQLGNALAEYRKIRPVASQEARSAEQKKSPD